METVFDPRSRRNGPSSFTGYNHLMIVRVVGCVVCCAAGMLSQSMGAFNGIWVYRVDGQNLMKVDIQMTGNSGTAVVTHPKQMSFSQDGIASTGSAEYVTEKPEPFTIESATLKFTNGVVITQTNDLTRR
jgi:hypothetical protein